MELIYVMYVMNIRYLLFMCYLNKILIIDDKNWLEWYILGIFIVGMF